MPGLDSYGLLKDDESFALELLINVLILSLNLIISMPIMTNWQRWDQVIIKS